MIRYNFGQRDWGTAQSILSWNLLLHLFLKYKYGLHPVFPIWTTLAGGGWYGSHFPFRCSSCFPQTQQRHEISLTSDSERLTTTSLFYTAVQGKLLCITILQEKLYLLSSDRSSGIFLSFVLGFSDWICLLLSQSAFHNLNYIMCKHCFS